MTTIEHQKKFKYTNLTCLHRKCISATHQSVSLRRYMTHMMRKTAAGETECMRNFSQYFKIVVNSIVIVLALNFIIYFYSPGGAREN